MLQETSTIAFHQEEENGNNAHIRQMIANYFEKNIFGTQDSVAQALNIDRGQVHKRLSEIEIIDVTNLAIVSTITGKLIKIWALKGASTITINLSK